MLKDARQATGKPLLTKGYYFDQGYRPTHKAEIIALYERGMDEADIARTTSHSATSVGRYLRDYERVRELAKRNIPLTQISRLLGLQPSVVAAYLDLIRQYYPHLSVPTVTRLGLDKAIWHYLGCFCEKLGFWPCTMSARPPASVASR